MPTYYAILLMLAFFVIIAVTVVGAIVYEAVKRAELKRANAAAA